MIRIGHKGADALVPGNTVESFRRAVEIGVDVVELDALWLGDGRPEHPEGERSPLVVAHDWRAAETGERLSLEQALAAFAAPPLDEVELDLDIKLAGRERELVEAVRRHGLVERTMVSTMEVEALHEVERLEPGIRRGWTIPRVSRDWSSNRYLRPVLGMAVGMMRRRLPGIVAARLETLSVETIWLYERLFSPGLLEVAHSHGVRVFAWTVDSADRVAELRRAGVDGIVSNDPRLLNA